MASHPHTELAFHVGDACQNMVEEADTVTPQGRSGGSADEQQAQALAAHQATIRVPTSRPPYGLDDDGNPIEPPVGGIPFDAETGALMAPDQWPSEDETTTRRAAGREAATARAADARAARAERSEHAAPSNAERPTSAPEPKG